MNEADYRDLITDFRRALRDADVPELSFLEKDPELAEPQEGEARQALLALLEGLGRYLAASDKATYDRALRTINRSIKGPKVTSVIIQPSDGNSQPIRLASLPQLSGVRNQLKSLIDEISNGPDSGPGEDPDQDPGNGPNSGLDQEQEPILEENIHPHFWQSNENGSGPSP